MQLYVPILAALLLVPLASRSAASAKPNVVIILMDDLGYGDVAPFGSKLNRTPNLDRMAAEGMKLTSFYCAPVCSASRAQLMTGSIAKRVSVGLFMPVSAEGLNPSELTIPELLKPQGYATMMVGKWHLGDQPEFMPTRQGFDHFFGLPYSNDQGAKPLKNGAVSDPESDRPPLPLLTDEKVIEAPVEQGSLTQRFTDESVKFITANQNRPFFLYFAHIATHVPLEPGPEFKGKSKNGAYGDWVEEADASVGRLLDTLRELKLDQRTLVIFTSDNGPWLSKGSGSGIPGPLRGGKFTTWEGGMREPTLAWWPGQIPAGTVSDAVLSQMDVLPTAVRLAGASLPTDRVIDGKDIWPVLSGQSKQADRDGLYYFGGDTLEAVRSGPWKLTIAPQETSGIKEKGEVKTPGSRAAPRLYNLDHDIGETTDVASQNPEVVKSLQTLISKMDADLGVKGKGLSIRPCGRVANPKPLLLRSGVEYD